MGIQIVASDRIGSTGRAKILIEEIPADRV